jgi:hypothetical protein
MLTKTNYLCLQMAMFSIELSYPPSSPRRMHVLPVWGCLPLVSSIHVPATMTEFVKASESKQHRFVQLLKGVGGMDGFSSYILFSVNLDRSIMLGLELRPRIVPCYLKETSPSQRLTTTFAGTCIPCFD